MFQQVVKNLRKINEHASSAASKPALESLKFGQDGPKIGPRRLQDLPKTTLKNFFLHLLFRLRFWSVLGPTWAPFDPPLGAQDGPKIDSKNVRKSRCRKMASKMAPRQPKIAPRRPRTPQRAPQDPPEPPPDPPKCAPRGSKIALRALKFAPRIPRRVVCVPKESPRVPEQLLISSYHTSV